MTRRSSRRPSGIIANMMADIEAGRGLTSKRCRHGHVCLVNAGRLLHPLGLDVCDLGAEGESDD